MAYGRGGQGKVRPDPQRIRDREKDRQDRENARQKAARQKAADAMAKSIRAKAKAANLAEKRRKEQLAKQKQAEADKRQQEQADAMAASIRAKAKAANLAEKLRKEQLAKDADYAHRRGIYQDAIAGMQDPTISPVVQKLLDESLQAGVQGTVATAKRGGPVGYTQRWKNARKKNK